VSDNRSRANDIARVAVAHHRIESLLEKVAKQADGSDGTLRAYVSGGKRLRARLVLATACVGASWDEDDVAAFGAFVELVHAGGLCHDDVVDRSPQRRGRASLAYSHGARAASLAGLHLIIGAYALIADKPRAVRQMVAHAAERVAIGQADEMIDLYRSDVDPEVYVARCRAKTGALFELAAELGGRAGHLDAVVREALGRFGAEVGLAFQLADDVRDLQGDAVVGRAPGTDLREGVYTLPVLKTAQGHHEGAAELRSLLPRIRRASDPTPLIAEVQRLLWRNGSVAATLDFTADVVARALANIEVLAQEVRPTFERFAESTLQTDVRRRGRATAA